MTTTAARQLGEHSIAQTDHFVADKLRRTPDTPFIHDEARTAETDHQDIVLDAQAPPTPPSARRRSGPDICPPG